MNIPQFIYPLSCWQTFELFPIFYYYKQCCNEHFCKCLVMHKCKNLGYKLILSYVIHIPMSEIAGLNDVCIFTFRYCLLGLQSVCTNLRLLQQRGRVPNSSFHHKHLKLSDFLIIPTYWIWNGTSCGLVCISLVNNEVEHLFIHLLAILASFSMIYLFIFYSFFYWVFLIFDL